MKTKLHLPPMAWVDSIDPAPAKTPKPVVPIPGQRIPPKSQPYLELIPDNEPSETSEITASEDDPKPMDEEESPI